MPWALIASFDWNQVFPGRTEDTYLLPLTRVVYIEEGDFRMQDQKDYFGLAPGKEVLLKCVACDAALRCCKGVPAFKAIS